MVVFRIVSILLGYLFGLFPTGVLYGKAHNVDIRSKGSGNSGMTNSLRVLGWKAGVVVFFGDCLKAVAAMAIIWGVAKTRYPDAVKLLELYAGFGAVLGHNFPFYMKFKGGKGIASSVGIVFAFDWRMVPICAILFFTSVVPTGFMSLGSLGILSGFSVDYRVWTVGIIKDSSFCRRLMCLRILTALAFWQHRANIKRLATGTENKFRPAKGKLILT